MAALIVLVAYLLGSLSGSLLLGGLRGVDIRTQGSGNAGGTNAFRTQGAAFALGAVAIDLGKGALAAWLGLRFGGGDGWTACAAAFAAALGHVWPVWHGFRGGKGAATLAGGVAVLWPAAAPVPLAAWLCVLIATGYVSLATILAGLSLAALALAVDPGPARLAFSVAAALLLVFTHRANIARLRAGVESRFDKARLLRRRARRA